MGPLIPGLKLLLMPDLAFKAHARFTSGATPADLLMARIVADYAVGM